MRHLTGWNILLVPVPLRLSIRRCGVWRLGREALTFSRNIPSPCRVIDTWKVQSDAVGFSEVSRNFPRVVVGRDGLKCRTPVLRYRSLARRGEVDRERIPLYSSVRAFVCSHVRILLSTLPGGDQLLLTASSARGKDTRRREAGEGPEVATSGDSHGEHRIDSLWGQGLGRQAGAWLNRSGGLAGGVRRRLLCVCLGRTCTLVSSWAVRFDGNGCFACSRR